MIEELKVICNKVDHNLTGIPTPLNEYKLRCQTCNEMFKMYYSEGVKEGAPCKNEGRIFVKKFLIIDIFFRVHITYRFTQFTNDIPI